MPRSAAKRARSAGVVAYKNSHGCSLKHDGAQRAASKIEASASGATGVDSKARGDQRSMKSGSMRPAFAIQKAAP